MIDKLNESVDKLNGWDVGLVKLYVAAVVLFIITIWGAAMTWVQSVNPWYFLIVAILAGIRPFYKYYIKK